VLRDSKLITLYYCETHPQEKVVYYDYSENKFECNVCKIDDNLRLFFPTNLKSQFNINLMILMIQFSKQLKMLNKMKIIPYFWFNIKKNK